MFPRLAFLGDAALHLATTEVLLKKYSLSDPGLVSIARAKTESRLACAKYATPWGGLVVLMVAT